GEMLLSRDYVGYMAKEMVKRLIASKMIETKNAENLTSQVGQVMAEELTIEDRLNEEVREILAKYSDEMRRTGVSYQEMYKKVKGQLARERKLILRWHALEPRKDGSTLSSHHRFSRFQQRRRLHRGPGHDPPGDREHPYRP